MSVNTTDITPPALKVATATVAAVPPPVVVSKPASWGVSLVSPLTITAVIGIVSIVVLRGRLIETLALTLYGASVSATRAHDYLAELRADRERARFICMPEARFNSLLAEVLRQAEAEKRAGDILLMLASRAVSGRWFSDTLQVRGARRMKNYQDLMAEHGRLFCMREDIDLNREVLAQKRTRKLILQMMTQLDMLYEASARAALAKLNELAKTFEWETLPPFQLPANVRVQLAKFLRLMAGTNLLEEARAAKAQFERLLNKYKCSYADIGV